MDPIEGDEVPKVDHAIAVGEDLAFQERWWTFERTVWIFFVFVLLADVLGVMGGGWLSHSQVNEPKVGMVVKYDHVVRTGTPNRLAAQFGSDAVRGDKIQLVVSDSVGKSLGAQRVIPQPETSAIAAGGMIYTFPAANPPGEVDFELQAGAHGIYSFRLSNRHLNTSSVYLVNVETSDPRPAHPRPEAERAAIGLRA